MQVPGAGVRRIQLQFVLAAIVGTVAAPAAACGYHDAATIHLGMLNLSYPEALHVRTAVWMAQRDGTLARPGDAERLPDDASTRLRAMLRYRETVAALDVIRTRLDGARGGRAVPSFSVVLIGPMLWTRFDTSNSTTAMSAHVDGPGRDHVVVVTDAPVLAALTDGRLSPESARRHGLIRFYGPAEASREVSSLLDRTDRSVPDTASRGSDR
jgi:hypothetical protein